jgi:uncharacterized protein YbjT (DUF2867 family)
VILVTGASGAVGSEIVKALLARRLPVRAFTRRSTRPFDAAVDIATGDLGQPDTFAPALTGVRSAFLLGGFATMPRLLRRMEEAGVRHVVMLTSRCVLGGMPDNAITRMWIESEAAVRDAEIAWTILRPSGFHSNALRWLPQLREGDTVRAPWPSVPIASIDPADIAAVAATALADAGYDGVELALSGLEALRPADQVATLARVLRRPLNYEPLQDDVARALMRVDTPPEVVDALFRFFSDGEFDDSLVIDTVRQITGREPRTFEQWATEHAGAFGRLEVEHRPAVDAGLK